MTPVHIAILVCHVTQTNGQVATTLLTTRGLPGMPAVLVMGQAVLDAMANYAPNPERGIVTFSIAEVRLETVEFDLPGQPGTPPKSRVRVAKKPVHPKESTP